MSTELETKLLETLGGIDKTLAALLESRKTDTWPKTTVEFAAYVGRPVRTVQDWIDQGLLRANRKVRPALITKANAERFLEGGNE